MRASTPTPDDLAIRGVQQRLKLLVDHVVLGPTGFVATHRRTARPRARALPVQAAEMGPLLYSSSRRVAESVRPLEPRSASRSGAALLTNGPTGDRSRQAGHSAIVGELARAVIGGSAVSAYQHMRVRSTSSRWRRRRPRYAANHSDI